MAGDEAKGGARLDRRSALVGALGGLVAGASAGLAAGSAGTLGATLTPVTPADGGDDDPGARYAKKSYAQQGEDLVMRVMLFDVARLQRPTYIDIGAWEPINSNNTYLFYELGSKGVLVEPNPVFAEKLRRVRARDTVLEVGVGVTDDAHADYYVFAGSDGQLNTFSKEQADALLARGAKLERTEKLPLVRLDAILAEHFPAGAPDILSIDVEGLDLPILKTLDYDKWRPRVICTETSEVGTGRLEQATLDFLATKDYQARGGSLVNTIFLDERLQRR